ncbi:hypothetical protein N9098_00850 [bacterium]|nr:hypothetical protein [bacterium]
MKHLLTAIACCLALAGSAQTPYNPDSDGDNLITVEDVMSTLSLYGGPFTPSYFNVEEICIVSSSNDTNNCFDVDAIPPITFLTYSDEIDANDDGSGYPSSHDLHFQFDEYPAPVIPNGTQWWILTSSDVIFTDINLSLVNNGTADIENQQTVRLFNQSNNTIVWSEEGNAGQHPRMEKYMWWEGDIIKMN